MTTFDQPGRNGYRVDSIENVFDKYQFTTTCRLCRKDNSIVVPSQGLWDWEHGSHVQDAFPSLSSDEREVLVSGMHTDCWDTLFGDDDE